MLDEKITILKKTTFKYGLVELRSDDILTYTPNKDVTNFTITHVRQLVEICLEITDGDPKLYFCDATHLTDKSSSETKAYFKSTLHLFAKACAVTENSVYITYLTRVFLYLYRPEVPLKLFKTKQKAISWLKSLNA